LKASKRPLCLYGHTHYLMTWALSNDPADTTGLMATRELEIPLLDGFKYLVNPGSVGQPRDGDPRAAYAIVDTDTRRVEVVRLPYSLEHTQDKIVMAGLPDVLAQRLGVGR
jgi:diadenosine tetraphosphatase ApaH/serine/threonine PP2A family protein phosphatase